MINVRRPSNLSLNSDSSAPPANIVAAISPKAPTDKNLGELSARHNDAAGDDYAGRFTISTDTFTRGGAVLTPAFYEAVFGNPETLASVIIVDMPPVAFDEVSIGLRDPAKLATQGVMVGSVEDVTVGGMEAVRISGTQSARGLTFPKCILVVRGASAVGVFSAQMPTATSGDACDLITGVAEREPPSVATHAEALPFALGDLGGMRMVNVLLGNTVMLTKGPLDGQQPGSKQPLMIVTQSVGAVLPQPDGRTAFSQQAMRGLAGYDDYDDYEITAPSDPKVTGKPATETTATATSTQDGQELRIVQWIRFGDDGYLRMIGISPADAWSENEPSFTAVRDGLTMRDASAQ